MSVRIEPQDGFKLKLSGDIETVISLSTRAVSNDFAVAFSDDRPQDPLSIQEISR